MPLFSETVSAAVAKKDIGASLLVHADFVGTPRRWWGGFGELHVGGEMWLGMGELISIDGIAWEGGTAASEVTFTLSGAMVTGDIVRMAKASTEYIVDRRIVVYIQFFHTGSTRSGAGQVHSTLDAPLAIWSGKMGSPQFSGDLSSRKIVVPATNLWADRNRPPYGLYTDRSQKGRFPGDRGLEQVARLTHKSLNWPATK